MRVVRQARYKIDEFVSVHECIHLDGLGKRSGSLHLSIFQFPEHYRDCRVDVSSRMGLHRAVFARSSDSKFKKIQTSATIPKCTLE